MKSVIVTIIFSILFTLTVFGNDSNSTSTDTSVPTDNCIFLDPEEKVVFIDFEEINGFAKEVVIKDGNGEVIFAQQLWDKVELNSNIYEWSFAEEDAANITIEVHTFTKVLTKEVETIASIASK